MGIDYGMGQVNVDKETGIRYGVINQNKLQCFALDDLYTNGEDVDFMEFRQTVKDDIERAIERVLSDHGLDGCNDIEDIVDVEAIVEEISFENYHGTGDCQRVQYDSDGYEISSDSQGDLFITKSPYYTLCDFCSPCAPGAGYLTSEGDVKAYCLDHDWFEDKAPYRVFNVSDDTEVLPVDQ